MEFSIITPWSNPLEEPITVEEIMRSEVDPPKSVKDFFQISMLDHLAIYYGEKKGM